MCNFSLVCASMYFLFQMFLLVWEHETAVSRVRTSMQYTWSNGLQHANFIVLQRWVDNSERCFQSYRGWDVVGRWRVPRSCNLALLLLHDPWTSYVGCGWRETFLCCSVSAGGRWHPIGRVQNKSGLAAEPNQLCKLGLLLWVSAVPCIKLPAESATVAVEP